MPRLSRQRISFFLRRGDNANTTTGKGQALEELICYIFKKVPGITIAKRNPLSYFESEEIDIAFWNERHRTGLNFLPNVILVECKNWNSAVGSSEVDWFISKIRRHGRDFGILVAMNGITGSREELNRAHNIVASALAEKIEIVIISRSEIEQLSSTELLVKLIKEKLCELAARGTVGS